MGDDAAHRLSAARGQPWVKSAESLKRGERWFAVGMEWADRLVAAFIDAISLDEFHGAELRIYMSAASRTARRGRLAPRRLLPDVRRGHVLRQPAEVGP